MLKVLAFSLYGDQAASHRVRLSQFVDGLSSLGIELTINSLLDNYYIKATFARTRPSLFRLFCSYVYRISLLFSSSKYDLLIVYGDLLPFFPSFIERILLKAKYIYDFDDAFFLKYKSFRFRYFNYLFSDKVDHLIASAVSVTAGSTSLSSYASRFNSNVSILPSVVDTDHFRPADPTFVVDNDRPFTVGWIGSPSTAPYLELLTEPLKQLALECSVRLIAVGGPAPVITGVEVIELPWSLDQEVSLIQQFDVGVMPLPDTPWTRGKCAYKLIQYMACGIPVVASSVGANVDVVPPGFGLLADSSQQWLNAFRQLVADPDLGHRLGTAARKWVEEHYSLRYALPVFTSVIQRAVAFDHIR